MQPWVVLSQGCTTTDSSDCPSNRGGIFNPNQSSTWQDQGLYSLVSGEELGIRANGDFGFDTVTVGLPGSAMTAKVEHQIVAGIAAKDFYLANWGIRPASTNLTNLNNPIPSLMDSMRTQGVIPSLSWGYTAGAYYMSLQNKGSLGSLTLGGYDAARFQNSSTTFPMGPDTSRDLLVGIQAISLQDDNKFKTAASLLPTRTLAFIDAGVPHLWLPLDACRAFESAFGLVWNATLDLYLYNSTAHSALVAQNPNVTLTLGSDVSSRPTVDITLPYRAFDLTLTPDFPHVAAATPYFPLRRAANASQVTLGRAFMQHAYVVADYERAVFSVNPAVFSDNAAQNIRAIPATNGPSSSNSTDFSASSSSSSSSALPVPVVVGATVGTLLVFFAICATAFFLWRRLRRRRQQGHQQLGPFSGGDAKHGHGGALEAGSEARFQLDAPDAGLAGVVVRELEAHRRKGELDAGSDGTPTSELPSPVWCKLKSELPGSPVSPLARGRWSGVKAVNHEASELP